MSKVKRIVLLFITLVSFYVMGRMLGFQEYLSVGFIAELWQKHPVLSFFIFINLFALAGFMQIPGMVLLIGAVLTLGKFWGGVVTYFAAVYGCSIIFLSVRKLGVNGRSSEVKSKTLKKLFLKLEQSPIKILMLMRLIGQTSPALNLGLAMSPVRFREYFVATAIIIPIPILINCYFFDYFLSSLRF